MDLPTQYITFDYTLQELYSLDGGKYSDIILAFTSPIPRVQAATSLPLSKKFTYQSPLAESSSEQDLAMRLLHTIPQRYGLIAGKTPLVLFELDSDDEENGPKDPRLPHIILMLRRPISN
ncbi:hypothetical protein BBP40_005822 [Aspergillus hancockii]|nr:hypothetical protein BBP40_005822 [Aspergillus hancockii]